MSGGEVDLFFPRADFFLKTECGRRASILPGKHLSSLDPGCVRARAELKLLLQRTRHQRRPLLAYLLLHRFGAIHDQDRMHDPGVIFHYFAP